MGKCAMDKKVESGELKLVTFSFFSICMLSRVDLPHFQVAENI